MLRSKIIFFAISNFCLACNTLKQVEGTYCILQKTVSPDNTKLILKSDNTFSGESWSDVAGRFSVSGYWRKSNDTLYFKIRHPRVVDSIIVSQTTDTSSILNIQVVDAEIRKPLEDVYISDGNRSYQTDNEGNVTIAFTRDGFLALEYMGIRDTISSSGLKKGEVKVFFNFKNLQTFSVSPAWLFKRHKIIPIEKGFSTFRKCE